MIIISDTSPLCYLILIDCVDVLPKLYNNVIIPQAVYQELQAEATPEPVKKWIQNHPNWLIIETINSLSDSELDRLDKGEQEAIILAEQIKADLLILDDKIARTIATQRGLKIIGLLGILLDAARGNLIDLSSKFNELQQTSFFVSPKLLESLIKQFNTQ
jgi:predicted nucleic acid-binding protein